MSDDMGPLPSSVGQACITVDGRLYTESDVRALVAEVARLSDRLNNSSDEDVADAGRVVQWDKAQTQYLRERLAGTAVIHYAPYGVHHEVYCGASCAEVGYTGDPHCVTCEACRAKSPGLFGNFSQDPTK